jgi:hypothetical protein
MVVSGPCLQAPGDIESSSKIHFEDEHFLRLLDIITISSSSELEDMFSLNMFHLMANMSSSQLLQFSRK